MTDLPNKLFAAFTNASHSHKNGTFFLETEYNGKFERFYFDGPALTRLVEEICEGYPMCVEYRKAVNALANAERSLRDVAPWRRYLTGEKIVKLWPCDYEEYMKIRDAMLDLSTPSRDTTFIELLELGSNPTCALHPEPKTSKFYSVLLSSKSWRTKKDFIDKKSVEKVRKEMIDAIIANPINAIKTNQYVFSVVNDYRIHYEAR